MPTMTVLNSIWNMVRIMSEGMGRTCAIFFLTLLFSLPLGLLVSLLRMSKNIVISTIAKVYISILRGTPLMLQLLAVTYGPYYLFGMNVAREKLIPVVIAFSLNYAAISRKFTAEALNPSAWDSMRRRRCWDTAGSSVSCGSSCRRSSSGLSPL